MSTMTKTFKLKVRNSSTYQFFINGFSKTTLWFIHFIVPKITIGWNMKFIFKEFIVNSLHEIKLNIGTLYLSTKSSQTILSSIHNNFIAKLIYRLEQTIEMKIGLVYTFRQIKRATSEILIKKIQINFLMLLVSLNALGDYDPDALSTLDSETLGDLDYIIL